MVFIDELFLFYLSSLSADSDKTLSITFKFQCEGSPLEAPLFLLEEMLNQAGEYVVSPVLQVLSSI